MDKTVEQSASADLFQVMAWMHTNRKQIITISVVVLVLAVGIGGYFWHKDNAAMQANYALADIKPPMPAQDGTISAPDPQQYVRVADEYSGTTAASRALLLAGEGFFETGKFDQAKAQFDRFLAEYPESPLASQASLGVAASLEAQGKTTEAASRYDDIIKRHPNDSIIPQAKSALARLYVAQNKPEQAMQLYQELARANNNDSWSAEAGIQLQELLAKYPNLRKQPAAAAPPAAMSAPASSTPKSSATVTVPISTNK